MVNGQSGGIELLNKKRYRVLCHLLPAVVCYDLWMPSTVFLLNKCATSGREKDAIASSDITKAPFVNSVALCRDFYVSGFRHPL